MAEKMKRKNEELPPRRGIFAMIFAGMGRGISWVVLGAWKIISGIVSWVWNSAGRILNFTLRQAWSAVKWAAALPFRAARFVYYTLVGWPISTGDPWLDEVKTIIRRRFQRRRFFTTHIFVFVAGIAALWISWFDHVNNPFWSGPTFPSGEIIFTIFWLMLLAYNFVRLKLGEAEDQALSDAIEQQRAWGVAEKQKRSIQYEVEEEFAPAERRFRLADDGELVESPAEYEEDEIRRLRHR